MIHLFLGLAVHEEREGLREPELGAAVQGHEVLPAEPERHGQDRTRRPVGRFGRGRAVAHDFRDLRGAGEPREDRDVPVGRVLGLGVEPQERSDSLHLTSPFHRVWGGQDSNPRHEG